MPSMSRLALGALATLPLLAACTTSTSITRPAASDVVATWTGTTLTLPEFETEYARQNGGREAASDDSLARMQDFLRRYVDFRLKVNEAERLGYASRPEIRSELDQYLQDYATPYLMDNRVLDPLVREVYRRQGTMIDASHILISVPRNAPPADTLAARQRLVAVLDSIDAGMSFGEAARKFSNDPSAQRPTGPGSEGRLGYFTSGDMVEEFEEAAYATPAGQRSPILRTQYGYHVLFVHDKMPVPPQVDVAHIMIVPQDGTPEAKARARAVVDSLQQRIAAGDDFGALAQQYSMDQGSAPRGGDLGYMEYKALPIEPFRTVAWGMTTPGQVSDVVETSFGFHLIKLIGRKDRPSFDEVAPQLKNTAARLPRAQRMRVAMLRDLGQQYHARVDTMAIGNAIASTPQDSLLMRFAQHRLPDAALDQVVGFVGDSTYTLRQFAGDVVLRGIPNLPGPGNRRVSNLTQRYMDEAVLRYAARDLPNRDPEFARLMKDFRDGTLLFKLMEDSVWTKAQTDTLTLRARYDARISGMPLLPERTRLVVISSEEAEALQTVRQSLDAGTPLAVVLANLPARTQSETVAMAGPTGSPLDAALNIPEGSVLGPIVYRSPSAGALVIRNGTEPARVKTFEEAMPDLISEYQRELENTLVNRLRTRYNARLYSDRLVRAFH